MTRQHQETVLRQFSTSLTDASKPGTQTSELWMTVWGSVISLLPLIYVLLKVKPEDQTALTDAIQNIGALAVSVLGQVAVIWKYIQSRQAVKEQAIQAAAQIHSAQLTFQQIQGEGNSPPIPD